MTVTNVSLAQLITSLTAELGRPVLDQTGLRENYDFQLEWLSTQPAIADPSVPMGAADIFTAIQEQLGLKLEPTRTEVEVIVIGSVQKPTEN
jgi:uncharacterized protein (TIGR03435 family)